MRTDREHAEKVIGLIEMSHDSKTKAHVDICLSVFSKLGIEVSNHKISDWGTDNSKRKYIRFEIGELHFLTYVDLFPNGNIDSNVSFSVIANNSSRAKSSSGGFIYSSETLEGAIDGAKKFLDDSVATKEEAYTQEKQLRSLLG